MTLHGDEILVERLQMGMHPIESRIAEHRHPSDLSGRPSRAISAAHPLIGIPMRNLIRLLLLPKVAGFLLATLLARPLPAQELGPSKMFEKLMGSIVVVKAFAAKAQAVAQGSGVELPSGLPVPNLPVVKGGAKSPEGQDENFVSAAIRAADTEEDLHQLKALARKVQALVGSTSTLKVVAKVHAVDFPHGLEPSS